MSTRRLSPLQILTNIPLETAREACWRALRLEGVPDVVIDAERNLVVGSTGANLATYGQNITAHLEPRGEGILISVKSEAQMQGTIDFGRSNKHAQSMADAIENALGRVASGDEPPLVEPAPLVAPVMAPPIASPRGEFAPSGIGGPVYGVAMPAKRGTEVLIYGLLSIVCCPIAAPFAWFYGSKALKEYGPYDPGDKILVRIGWVLGILVTLALILLVGLMILGAIVGPS